MRSVPSLSPAASAVVNSSLTRDISVPCPQATCLESLLDVHSPHGEVAGALQHWNGVQLRVVCHRGLEQRKKRYTPRS